MMPSPKPPEEEQQRQDAQSSSSTISSKPDFVVPPPPSPPPPRPPATATKSLTTTKLVDGNGVEEDDDDEPEISFQPSNDEDDEPEFAFQPSDDDQDDEKDDEPEIPFQPGNNNTIRNHQGSESVLVASSSLPRNDTKDEGRGSTNGRPAVGVSSKKNVNTMKKNTNEKNEVPPPPPPPPPPPAPAPKVRRSFLPQISLQPQIQPATSSHNLKVPLEGVSVFHLKRIFLEQIVLDSKTHKTTSLMASTISPFIPTTWISCSTCRGSDGRLTRSSTIYDIEDINVTEDGTAGVGGITGASAESSGRGGLIRQNGEHHRCPIDGRPGAAYVHCLQGKDHVGKATHILSYAWSYEIGEIVDALWDYCYAEKINPKRTYIWIDVLCLNQHRVDMAAQQKAVGILGGDFFASLEDLCTKQVRHVLFLLAKKPYALERMWCNYELCLAKENGCKFEFLMSPITKEELLEEDLLDEGEAIDSIYAAVDGCDVENAKAYKKEDKRQLLTRMEQMELSSKPSYRRSANINAFIKKLVREWMKVTILEFVAKTTRQLRGRDPDEEYAEFCSKVGTVLARNGEYDDALELHMRALSIRQSNIGKLHPDLAKIYNDFDKGDFDSTKSMEEVQAEETPAIQDEIKNNLEKEAVQGGDELMHAETPTVDDNNKLEQEAKLGDELMHPGDELMRPGDELMHAGDELMHSAEDKLITTEMPNYDDDKLGEGVDLGDEDPESAISRSKAASQKFEQGEFRSALKEYSKCLSILEADADQLNIATTYNNIGTVLEAMGDLEGALESYQQCLVLQELFLGARNHPDMASVYNNIGHVLYALEEYDVATKYLQKCVEIQNVEVTAYHSIAMTHNNLGLALMKKGDYDEALVAFDKCLTIQRHALGRNHPTTANTYNNIGSLLRRQNDLSGALQAYQKSLAIDEAALGRDHIDTATTHTNIGLTLKDMKDLELAQEHFHRVQFIVENELGKCHPRTARAYKNMGLLLDSRNDLEGALEAYCKALAIEEEVFGPQHEETATTYQNIGAILFSMRDFEGAFQCTRNAAAIRELVFGKSHPDTGESQRTVAFVEQAIGAQ